MTRTTLAASLLAAAALAGCIEPEPCEELSCGPCVVWHRQIDRDLCGALATCGPEAREAAGTAVISFVAAPREICGTAIKLNGCNFKSLVVLKYVPRIADGALCHELDHAAGLPVP